MKVQRQRTNRSLHTQNIRYQINQLFWNFVKILLKHTDLLIQKTVWYVSRRSVIIRLHYVKLVSIDQTLQRKIVKGIEVVLQFQIVLNGSIDLKMVRRVAKIQYPVRSIHNDNQDKNLLAKLTSNHYQSVHQEYSLTNPAILQFTVKKVLNRPRKSHVK